MCADWGDGLDDEVTNLPVFASPALVHLYIHTLSIHTLHIHTLHIHVHTHIVSGVSVTGLHACTASTGPTELCFSMVSDEVHKALF